MKKYIILTFCLFLVIGIIPAQNQSKRHSMALITKVIDDFQTGIIKKDSLLLQSLFFEKSTPIIGIMSEPTEMSIKKNNPQFQGISVSNSQRFIGEICGSKKKQFEKFSKTKIKISEKLADVQFYYAFYADEKVLQWGEEKWSMVFAENQWFITGINFTIRFPSIEKLPSSL